MTGTVWGGFCGRRSIFKIFRFLRHHLEQHLGVLDTAELGATSPIDTGLFGVSHI